MAKFSVKRRAWRAQLRIRPNVQAPSRGASVALQSSKWLGSHRSRGELVDLNNNSRALNDV